MDLSGFIEIGDSSSLYLEWTFDLTSLAVHTEDDDDDSGLSHLSASIDDMTLRESDTVSIDDDFFETDLLLTTHDMSFFIDIDDITIISEKDIRWSDPEFFGGFLVFHSHEEFSMHGDEVFRSKEGQHEFLLFFRSMPCRMKIESFCLIDRSSLTDEFVHGFYEHRAIALDRCDREDNTIAWFDLDDGVFPMDHTIDS